MAKKQKAARRRKNGGVGDDDVDNSREVDVLSEAYTILSDDQSLGDVFGDDILEELDLDDLIEDDTTKAESSATIRQSKLLDSLSLASTLSTEKRATKREQGLRTLFKAMTQYATGAAGQEIIQSRLEEVILPICFNGLRGGTSPAEQYASCRVLEATSILLGGNNDDYAEQVCDKLVRVVKMTQRAGQVRGAALRALAMAFFICATDVDSSDVVLNLCEQVCAPEFRNEAVPPNLRATALDCWALLSTTIHNAYLAGSDIPGSGDGRGLVILPLLSDCLNSTNLDLRCAAGECVALIHEARLELGIDDEQGENASERRYRRGSWDGSEWEVLMDEVKQRVAELSIESGKHMSKKAKKEQKSTFREFMSTIVDDEAPCEVVAFRGGQLTLTNWKEIIQLNYIRHCLQTGFQVQLMTNSTLQLIFGADGDLLNTATQLSQLEKRHHLSKASEANKQAYNERNKVRKSRVRAQNSFIHADGEGI